MCCPNHSRCPHHSRYSFDVASVSLHPFHQTHEVLWVSRAQEDGFHNTRTLGHSGRLEESIAERFEHKYGILYANG